jgi:hypothetical protein
VPFLQATLLSQAHLSAQLSLTATLQGSADQTVIKKEISPAAWQHSTLSNQEMLQHTNSLASKLAPLQTLKHIKGA